eukprot:jgi/Pico_ML_1/52452/g3155.t1
MYKRDVGVLLVSVIGIYFTLSQEGALEMRPTWYHPATRVESQVDVAEERPRPRVSDLNGDGAAEVIVAAWDGSLQLLDVRVRPPASRSFAAARLLAEVSAPKHRHADGTASEATPVAFSVGYLDPMPMEKVWKKRKQVVAVVGSDGKLRTYDHNLRLRWEIALEREMPRHTRIEQAALRITRHANEAFDRGTVIVGWSLELGDVDADDPVRSERRLDAHLLQGRHYGEASCREYKESVLKSLPHRGHLAETIVVAGSQSGSIMSRAGDKMASFNFPSPPVQPLEVLDFNADGLNDIILCTADGYYGFVQVRHSGGVPFGALIGMMIVAIVVIWMVQVSQEEDVKMRSTEAL